MLSVFVLLIGLSVGSFLNVCIYRIPRKESILSPASHCTNCSTKIKLYDLVPLMSYFILRGKCRHCGESISIRYPIIELAIGTAFLMLYNEYGIGLIFIKYAFLLCFLIVIGIIDFDTSDVYFKTTISGIITGILFLLLMKLNGAGYLTFIIGGLIGGGLIAVIIILTHGMGWGDVEICLLAGLYLGIKLIVLMLILSFVLGAFTGLTLILLKKKNIKDFIPFGPFITAAGLIAIFAGERVINLYVLKIANIL